MSNANHELSPLPVSGGSAVALAPGAVGGRRRASKKLRVVKKKTVKRMLKKMGLKMRGGKPADPTAAGAVGSVLVPEPESDEEKSMGGRRRRGSRKTRRKSLFGLKY
jgi:hypothetical protein